MDNQKKKIGKKISTKFQFLAKCRIFDQNFVFFGSNYNFHFPNIQVPRPSAIPEGTADMTLYDLADMLDSILKDRFIVLK